MTHGRLPRPARAPAALYGAAVLFFLVLVVAFIGSMLADEARICSSNLNGGVRCTGGNDSLSYVIYGALISLAGIGLYLSNRAFRLHAVRDEVFAPAPRPGLIHTVVVASGVIFFGWMSAFVAAILLSPDDQPSGSDWVWAIGILTFLVLGLLIGLVQLVALLVKWRRAW